MKILMGFISLLAFIFSACSSLPVRTGLDNVNDYSDLFAGKRIGIITNHTGYNHEGKYIADVFKVLPDVRVTALFGPEHGIHGNHAAGSEVDSAEDSTTQIPIFSLYGATRKPTPEMLTEVDILVFDIQDVGARFYTYIYTMALAMEAAAEQGKIFVVLDRPNPINGVDVEGNILEPEFATFVGMYPIPVRHGMTIGELAQLFNGEGMLANGVKAELKVIPMKNWKRNQWYDQTGLEFIAPSPNIPDFATMIVYPGLCLWEGTNASEGRGTYHPFVQFGAPWINKATFTSELNNLHLAGCRFEENEFTPISIPGMSENPKQENKPCFGSKVVVTDRNTFEPYWTGIKIIEKTYQLYPDSLNFRSGHFDRLCGTAKIREAILNNASLDDVRFNWQEKLNEFKQIRKKYLIY